MSTCRRIASRLTTGFSVRPTASLAGTHSARRKTTDRPSGKENALLRSERINMGDHNLTGTYGRGLMSLVITGLLGLSFGCGNRNKVSSVEASVKQPEPTR